MRTIVQHVRALVSAPVAPTTTTTSQCPHGGRRGAKLRLEACPSLVSHIVGGDFRLVVVLMISLDYWSVKVIELMGNRVPCKFPTVWARHLLVIVHHHLFIASRRLLLPKVWARCEPD